MAFMRLYILRLIVFLSVVQSSVLAQEDAETLVLPNPKMGVGLHYMINSTFRELTGQEFAVDYRSVEAPRSGFTIGSSVEYKIHQLVGIESGLYFSRKAYGGIKSDSSEFYTRYLFFDVPIQANGYFFKSTDVEFFVGIGGTAHLLLQPLSIERINTSGEIHRKDLSDVGYNAFTLSARGVLGVNYNLNPVLQVRAQGGVNFGVTPIYDREVTEKLYDSFVSLGVIGRF